MNAERTRSERAISAEGITRLRQIKGNFWGGGVGGTLRIFTVTFEGMLSEQIRLRGLKETPFCTLLLQTLDSFHKPV